jgi:hypothetical protein
MICCAENWKDERILSAHTQIYENGCCKAYVCLAAVVTSTLKQMPKSTFIESTRFQNSVLNVVSVGA